MRAAKNSSRLDDQMERNRTRSMMGKSSRRVCSSTRRLKCSHDSSWLMRTKPLNHTPGDGIVTIRGGRPAGGAPGSEVVT